MKKAIFIFLAIIGLSFGTVVPQQGVTAPLNNELVKNKAFKKGEMLKYRIHYGFIDAAEATIEIKNEEHVIGGRKALHVLGLGYSKKTFDWFFRVRDRYETYIDEEKVVPLVFIRRVDEGGYIINQNMVFNHKKKKVDSDGKIFDVPENVQDMLSAFFYARCLDFSNAKEGDVFTISSFVDNQMFPIMIKYVGKETIKSDVGKIRCLKFRPVVQTGRIFKKEEDLKVWISDDKNHIPIRAQADIMFGSLKMDLTEYTGLANEVSEVK
jgi:hypothetical protein